MPEVTTMILAKQLLAWAERLDINIFNGAHETIAREMRAAVAQDAGWPGPVPEATRVCKCPSPTIRWDAGLCSDCGEAHGQFVYADAKQAEAPCEPALSPAPISEEDRTVK
jgi:hypothetical protein